MSAISANLSTPPDNFSTTLSSGIASNALSIPLNSVSGLPTEGIGVIFTKDANGEVVAGSVEIIHWTGVGGSALTLTNTGDRGLTGSDSGAQAYSAGAYFEVWVTSYYYDSLLDGIAAIDIGALTAAATSKATPVDADSIPLSDSAASNVLKKLTWANLKATLLTWLRLSTTIIPVNAPEGFLINGKIDVTVSSNNITLALKTLAGADPSASDPVYIRINGVVRTITAALSVTKNAGTNWFNSGSSAFAAKSIDYFAYLGYNATDGVVIGFSRIPFASTYGEFSATTTNEKYCAISTITTAASTDYYTVIGRFEALLSASASFNWSVPTFTGANLIQRPIYETRTLQWSPTVDWTGTDPTTPTTTARYKLRGTSCKFDFRQTNTGAGSSNTEVNFTLPFVAAFADAFQTSLVLNGYGSTTDSSGSATTAARPIIYGTTAVQVYVIFASTIAGRAAYCNGEYEI